MSSNIYTPTKEEIAQLYWADFVVPSEEEMLTGATLSGWGGDTFSGKTHTEETKKKMSASAKTRKYSAERGKKISEANKGKYQGPTLIVDCPHCNKKGDIGNMKRWHFDNCKAK